MHGTTADFWKEYRALPADVRERADKQFALLKVNPRHPSLQFKKLTEWRGKKFGPLASRANIALSPRRTTTIMSGSGLASTTHTTTSFNSLDPFAKTVGFALPALSW